MSYIQEFKKYAGLCENWIEKHIVLPDLPERNLYKSMRYSLFAGGKRIRPVLSLAVCDLLGGEKEAILPFACAIELIHTYSLIHDDLPSMDNDDLRRGKPTNHKVFGEAMAILAGDALLNKAYEIMLKEIINQGDDSMKRAKAAAIIGQAAGCEGMIAGQVVDIEAEAKILPYDSLCYMHERKTGALLKASIMIAAELCEVSAKVKEALYIYAQKIGLAFQIKDDILDFEGNTNVVGKPVGSDEKNKKSTFVTILGAGKAKELLKESVEQAVKVLEPVENADFLVKTAAYIAEREK